MTEDLNGIFVMQSVPSNLSPMIIHKVYFKYTFCFHSSISKCNSGRGRVFLPPKLIRTSSEPFSLKELTVEHVHGYGRGCDLRKCACVVAGVLFVGIGYVQSTSGSSRLHVCFDTVDRKQNYLRPFIGRKR